jgi:polyphosphate glucokinase
VDVLAIAVGGTRVKFRVSGSDEVRRFRSGPDLTPDRFTEDVTQKTSDWHYDVISIGYPGSVARGTPIAEPGNLGPGWVDCDFETAFGRPVRVTNDAILQALGAYRSGRMLFLGLGTGVGSALVSRSSLSNLAAFRTRQGERCSTVLAAPRAASTAIKRGRKP